MTISRWTEATHTIEAAQTIVIVTHLSPDGDAIGSLLGLANAMKEMGKTVVAAVDGGVPQSLAFCPGADSVVPELKEGRFDVMISTDASDEPRTGHCGQYARAHSGRIINLDHHPTNTLFGDVHLVVPSAVSATEIVYDWLSHMSGYTMSAAVAQCLLLGLVTDTLGFRTSGVSSRTLDIARDLIEKGAQLAQIMARTLENHSYQVIRLWKQALPRVELRNQIVHTWIAYSDFQAVGLNDASDGGLVSLLNTVAEAVVAVVFKETETGEVELSLRSKPGYDVSAVAFQLGGGGHKQAAGATIAGPIPDAQARVLPMLDDVVRRGQSA